SGLTRDGHTVVHDHFFDTVLVHVPGKAAQIQAAAKAEGVNIWCPDGDHVSIACDEATTLPHLVSVLRAFGTEMFEGTLEAPHTSDIATRDSDYLTHPAFNRYHSETEMMRYLRALSDKDIALDRSMIPLGSCTMKLNAAAEMEPITWPQFAAQHPFAPASDSRGLRTLISDLEGWLADITGYDKVSLQPNAGSQGEYAGLLAIRQYHIDRGD
ncbi:glycine dehydrogenase (aminomethyl-transferring), partial [Mycolicibacter hiberniae]|nr:glycine dehydrogenase (aminomethyl-transferring) [Mycolicibacter hiberniae]